MKKLLRDKSDSQRPKFDILRVESGDKKIYLVFTIKLDLLTARPEQPWSWKIKLFNLTLRDRC